MRGKIHSLIMIPLSFYFFCTLTGCMTVSLKDVVIQDINVTLVRTENADAHTPLTHLIPGNVYRLVITVRDTDNKEIKNPRLEEFILSSPNNTIIEIRNVPFYGYQIIAADETSVFLKEPGYRLSIAVRDNPFTKEYTWPCDWTSFIRLNYSGKAGRDGWDGSDGKDGSSGSDYDANGGNGGDGGMGDPGGNGKDAYLYIAYYDAAGLSIGGLNDSKLFIIYDRDSRKTYLSGIHIFTIDASGGKGGNGGNGGDAGIGITYTKADPVSGEDITVSGKDGKAGDGGNGGKGGNGGSIFIFYSDEEVLNYFNPVVSGGQGGNAGNPGGSAFGSFSGAFSGNSGSNGGTGNFNKIKITGEEMRNLFSAIGNDTIEIERLITE